MAQILREQGPYAALEAIKAAVAAAVPPWTRRPVDPWQDTAQTVCFRTMPAWMG